MRFLDASAILAPMGLGLGMESLDRGPAKYSASDHCEADCDRLLHGFLLGFSTCVD